MNPTLLLVDDEPAIADAIETSLLDEHYTIYKAGCAAEALSILEQHDITVVITDQVMPGMSGLDLCTTIHQRWPTTYRILLSNEHETSITPASLNGDVHQNMAKPWDAMLLRYNINEGIRQQKILQQALYLSEKFQQKDQACLITDKNWVIQIASPSTAQWLGYNHDQLIGKNLFSKSVSNNSIEQETQLINTLEGQNHWQGSFQLNTQSIHGSEAWMCIVPFDEQHYLCLAIPMIDDMLNKLTGKQKSILKQETLLNIDDKSEYSYLKIIPEHANKLDLDFITVINEHLQHASDGLYHIIATLEGDHIIQLPKTLEKAHLDNLLGRIQQNFLEPILFQGREAMIKWKSERMQSAAIHSAKPQTDPDIQDIQSQHKDPYQGHSYFLPHHYEKSGFSCLPLFDQDGKAVALMPPACPNRDNIEQWLKDALYCSQEWQNYSDKPIHWFNDFSDLKPHQSLKALAAIVALSRQKGQEDNTWKLILSSEQLLDIKQADSQIQSHLESLNTQLLVKNPDYHLNTIKDLTHHLPKLFTGISIDSHWLFDGREQIKRHSMQLLSHLKNQNLLIVAQGISSPQQLALLHKSPCHWLAGDILSTKLLPQQISWLHQ